MPKCPQPQIYLNGMTLEWMKNARYFGNIATSQLKYDTEIQLNVNNFMEQ